MRRPFDAVADAELSTACSYRDMKFMVHIYSDETDSLVVRGLEQIDGVPSPYLRRAGAGMQQAADGLLLRCFNGGAVIARQSGLWMYRGSEGQSAGGEHGVVFKFEGCKASRGIVADRQLRLTLYVPWNAPVYVWPLPSDVAVGLLRDAVFG